jgi:hemoglobin-like flavoprotein
MSDVFPGRGSRGASSRRQALLEESLELSLLRDPDFPRLFYDILFRDYPSTRALFKQNSLNAQRTMLSKTLMAAVDHIDDPAWLDETLRSLGADHQGYGVTPEMYDWMSVSLKAALAETCGSEWTPEHGLAWDEALAILVRAMRAGETAR